MPTEHARTWIILSSIVITGAITLFLFLAPALGYPLRQDQARRIMEIVVPVFIGYLGSASHFVFRELRKSPSTSSKIHHPKLAKLLIKGPIILWVVIVVGAFIAFGISNRESAEPGAGWSVDELAAAVTFGISLLAVTTNVAVAYLFGSTDHLDIRTPH